MIVVTVLMLLVVALSGIIVGAGICENESSMIIWGIIFIIILMFIFCSWYMTDIAKAEVELFNLKNNTEYTSDDWMSHQDFIKKQYITEEGKE